MKAKKLLSVMLVLLMLLTIFPANVLAEFPVPDMNNRPVRPGITRPWEHPVYAPGLEPELLGIVRQAAVESIVLLENEPAIRSGAAGNVLPLPEGTNVAVFGRHQINHFLVGYGSGGEVNYPHSVNFLQALRRHPGINVNEDIAEFYTEWTTRVGARTAGWAAWPFSHPEMPVNAPFFTAASIGAGVYAELGAARNAYFEANFRAAAQTAADNNEVAIIFIGRAAGEDRDNLLNRTPVGILNQPTWGGHEGSWYLTDAEVGMLEFVSNTFDDVIVLINSGNIIDMSWLDGADAAVNGSHICGQGANATTEVAHSIFGMAGTTPSHNLHEFCVPHVLAAAGNVPIGGGGNAFTDAQMTALMSMHPTLRNVCVYARYGNIDVNSIRAVAYVWQGGMDAGPAIVDVLTGEQSPSGRLHATIPMSIDDHPAARQSGYRNRMQFGIYEEDVFVGYRYFETFNHSAVRYAFGFGLSYTTFDINVGAVTTTGTFSQGSFGWGNSEVISIPVTVTNTGNHAAKQVVQVYHSAPQSELAKPARELIAYAKTNTLLPGQSETLTITFNATDMSSFADFPIDLANGTIAEHAWVMEAGNYNIFVGTSVCSTRAGGIHGTPVYTFNLATGRITNQLSEALMPEVPFYRMAVELYGGAPVPGSNGPYTLAWQPAPQRSLDLRELILTDLAANDTWAPDMPYNSGPPIQGIACATTPGGFRAPIQLADVVTGTATLEAFMAQMTVEELADLTRGNSTAADMMSQPDGIGSAQMGIAGVFAGNNPRMRNFFGIPSVAAADGPSGLRMTPSATLMPMATALAATWNDRLVEDLYTALGREMLRNGVDMLLAPGMDLQRTPLNGRNFEYFSEDALLNGNMGANAVRGMHNSGVTASPKHFTANNQEGNRYNHNAIASSRALNELYVRGYENIINHANLQATMGSYALINGRFSHMNYELNHIVMRKHLGFEGLIMTDWWLRVDYGVGHPSIGAARGRGAHTWDWSANDQLDPNAPFHMSRAYSKQFDLGPGAIRIDRIENEVLYVSLPVDRGISREELNEATPREIIPLPGFTLPRDGRQSTPAALGAPGSGLANAAFTRVGAIGGPTNPAGQGVSLNNLDIDDGFRFAYNTYRLRGRLDLLMPGNQWRGRGTAWAYNGDGAGNPHGVNWSMSNPIHMYRLGFIGIGEIQASARNVLHVAKQTAGFRIDNNLAYRDFDVRLTDSGGRGVAGSTGAMTPIFQVTQPGVEPPMLSNIFVDGMPLDRFVRNVQNYVIFAGDLGSLPSVTVSPASASYTVTTAVQDVTPGVHMHYRTVTITVTDNNGSGLSRIYRVHFTNEFGLTPEFDGAVLARLASVSVNGELRPDFHPMRWQAPWAMQVADVNDVILQAIPAEGSWVVSQDRIGNQYRIHVLSEHQGVVYVINLQTAPPAGGLPIPESIVTTVITTTGQTRMPASLARNWQFPQAAAVGNNADPESEHGGGAGATPNQHLVMTPVNRFATYNIYVEEAGQYLVRARYASNFGAVATHLLIPMFVGFNEDVGHPDVTLTYGATGGLGTGAAGAGDWQNTTDVILTFENAGPTWFRVLSRDGNFNLNWIEFERLITPSLLQRALNEVDARNLVEADFPADVWAAYIVARAAVSEYQPGVDTEAANVGRTLLYRAFRDAYKILFELAPPAAPTEFNGSNPNVLRALLEEGDVILTTSGNLGIFTHHSPFVIPAGRTLTVASTLNVQGNAELVIDGTLVVQAGGRVNNQGGAGGTIIIAGAGELINNGHVENVTNSTVINKGTIINNARFEIRASTTICDCDGIVVGTTPLNIHRNANVCDCDEELKPAEENDYGQEYATEPDYISEYVTEADHVPETMMSQED